MPPEIVVFVRSPATRARLIGLRILAASFLSGAFVTVTTSGGMVCERLSFGDPSVAAVTSVMVVPLPASDTEGMAVPYGVS